MALERASVSISLQITWPIEVGRGAGEVEFRHVRPRNGRMKKSRASSADNATYYLALTSFVVDYLRPIQTSIHDWARQCVSHLKNIRLCPHLAFSLPAALDPDKAMVIPVSSVGNFSVATTWTAPQPRTDRTQSHNLLLCDAATRARARG